MSVETATSIAEFLHNNEIRGCTLMGGEFFCNPNWRDIFKILLNEVDACRLVTNGDWAEDDTIIETLELFKEKMVVSISEDKWHTNKHTTLAKKKCKDRGFHITLPTDEMQRDEVLVPVGNLRWEPLGIYGMFATYCSNPKSHYHFLIDEDAKIYKCGFGVWDYANAIEYKDGGFAERFKEFNKLFYSQYLPNCSRCSQAYHRRKD